MHLQNNNELHVGIQEIKKICNRKYVKYVKKYVIE